MIHSLVQTESHEDVPRILSDDNELVIREDNDIIDSKQNTTLPDEDFERNFRRAVDRALGVVNKDENHVTQPIDDIPTETDKSHLNLLQMTEQALSSFNNSSLFTVNKKQFF